MYFYKRDCRTWEYEVETLYSSHVYEEDSIEALFSINNFSSEKKARDWAERVIDTKLPEVSDVKSVLVNWLESANGE